MKDVQFVLLLIQDHGRFFHSLFKFKKSKSQSSFELRLLNKQTKANNKKSPNQRLMNPDSLSGISSSGSDSGSSLGTST